MFVESEKKFNAQAVGGEGVLAVAAVHCAVERLVSLGKAWRHRHRIVKVSQGAAGELLAGGKDFSRTFFDFRALGFRRIHRPWKKSFQNDWLSDLSEVVSRHSREKSMARWRISFQESM
jgi:hypothetical protein